MYELQEKAIAIARNILVSEFHYAPSMEITIEAMK